MLNFSSCERNKEPILAVLKQHLSCNGHRSVVEVASGSGQHVSYFAPHFPATIFQPSDFEQSHIRSIDAYVQELQLANVKPAVYFNAEKSLSDADNSDFARSIPESSVDLVLNSNMIHISSNAAVDGLFQTAGQILKGGGLLLLYGPFAFSGIIEPASNKQFDSSLRSQNPEWGYRDLDLIKEKCMKNGISTFKAKHDMPANNHIFVFEKDLS